MMSRDRSHDFPDADFFAQTALPCVFLVEQSKGKSKSRKNKIFSLKYLLSVLHFWSEYIIFLKCPTFLVEIYNFLIKKIYYIDYFLNSCTNVIRFFIK